VISSRPTEKTCRVCPKVFTPVRPMQVVCGLACARRVPVIAKKADKAAARRERARTKARREALKTLSDWTKEAQVAFNAWVRARDVAAGHGCIDCGRPFEPTKPGGSIDAGHYLSRGAAVHLRFDERNVFAQRKNCNRPGGATRADFRAGVIARIGLAAVESLEADQTVKQYRADDLKAIRDEYRARLKALRA
jgi:hypothetical protein